MAPSHAQIESNAEIEPIRGTLVRGGTSKCWLFDSAELGELGSDRAALERLLSSAFGSADAKQLNGVGAGTSTTSKAAVVERGDTSDIDVRYTFGQVGIGDRRVEWGSNCGNCATAVGLYAVHNGLVAPDGEHTRVRMWNTNTRSRIDAMVRTPGGAVPSYGSAVVPGVTGRGVAVGLEFRNPVGPSTGTLLPTGNAKDELECAGQSATASLVDAGAPAALLAAETVGLRGTESIAEFTERLPEILSLRQEAAVRMGLRGPSDPVDHAVPKLGIVGPPADYRTADGEAIAAGDYDLSVRMVSMHAPHPSIGLTSVVAVLAGAVVPGSTVHEILGDIGEQVRVGTPAGVVAGTPVLDADGALGGARLARSARVLAEATIFVPDTELVANA